MVRVTARAHTITELNACRQFDIAENAPVAASWLVWIRVVVDRNHHLQHLFHSLSKAGMLADTNYPGRFPPRN